MWQVIFSTYHKNRIGILRAVPWSFMVSRVITGVTQIIFPYFVYRYFMHGNLNNEFSKYVNGADYITYIVLGSALNVLAVATLMNIGKYIWIDRRKDMDEQKIIATNLAKNYVIKESALFGRKKKIVSAVKDITLEIPKGQIIGVLGINGAGKTTTIRMLASIIAPSSGTLTMNGVDAVKNHRWVKERINVISGGERNLYWRLTAIENLKYFGSLYGLSGVKLKEKIAELLKIVGLEEAEDIPVERYSKGMKQRLQILILPFIFLLLLLSSTIWGGMLNSIFMFSRDASIIMDIFDTPMTLFSGSRIPRNCFPFWAKMISLVFPLTYCINIIRFVLNIGGKGKQWILNIAGLLVCMCIMVAVTVVLTYQVERHNRETGELQLY